MTTLELPPLRGGGGHPHHIARTEPEPHRPDQALGGRGGLLQFQLRRLIDEILTDPAVNSDACTSLMRHLHAHPRHPERALIAHLHAVHDPGDLPPFKGCR
jgi:hypothetical protein